MQTWSQDWSCVDQDECAAEQDKNGRGSVTGQPCKIATRRTARIIRRKEPTVEFRAKSVCPTVSESFRLLETGYSTIEKNSFDVVGALSITPFRNVSHTAKMCGWRIDEHAQNSVVRISSDSFKGSARETATSNRLYSGIGAKLSRKRGQYRFKHFSSAAEHMKHYKDNFAYSEVTMAGRHSSPPEARNVTSKTNAENNSAQPASENQTMINKSQPLSLCTDDKLKEGEQKPDTKKTQGHHLHKLASRLGVQQSIMEPQLLKSHQCQSPPTFSRNGDKEELVKCSARTTQNESTSNGAQSKRPETSKKGPRLNQLPTIPSYQQRKKRSTSTISVNKYLHVNNGSVRDEEEEQDSLMTTAGGTTSESQRYNSSSLSKDAPDSPDRKATKKKVWPTFDSSDPIVHVTDVQTVIQRKADSLGLLSRKWAKNVLRGALANSCLTHHLEQRPSPSASRASSKGIAGSRTGHPTEDYHCKMKELKSVYSAKSRQMSTRGIPSVARQCRAESRNGSSNKQGSFTRPPTHSSMRTSLPKEKQVQHSAIPHSREAKKIRKTLSQTARINGQQRKLQQKTDKWRLEGEKWTMAKVSQLEGILEVQQRVLIATEIS